MVVDLCEDKSQDLFCGNTAMIRASSMRTGNNESNHNHVASMHVVMRRGGRTGLTFLEL